MMLCIAVREETGMKQFGDCELLLNHHVTGISERRPDDKRVSIKRFFS